MLIIEARTSTLNIITGSYGGRPPWGRYSLQKAENRTERNARNHPYYLNLPAGLLWQTIAQDRSIKSNQISARGVKILPIKMNQITQQHDRRLGIPP
jgi:hypothetical protein